MLTLALMLAAAAGPAPVSLPLGVTPLLDGRCDAAEWQGAATLAQDGAYRVRAMHDAHYVYLCVAYPAGSLGMVDLYLATPDQPGPINLHASRKLGERVFTAGTWPRYVWWNETGWTTQVNAIDRLDGDNTSFHAYPQREVQLSRARFGAGRWRLAIDYLADDGSIPMRFPAAARNHDPATFLAFDVP